MGVGAAAAIPTSKGKLVNDMQLMLQTFVLETLGGILMDPINEQVMPQIATPLEPLNALVPKPLKDFLDVNRIADQVVTDTIVAELKAKVEPALAPHLQALAGGGGA